MIEKAQRDNQVLTWIIRVIGFLLWFGLMMVLRPLSVIADVLPILGSVIGAGAGVIAFLASVVFWAVTVAIAWLVYRPLSGGVLLLVAVLFLFLLGGRLRKGRSAASWVAG